MSKIKVLIVDDESLARDLIKSYLTDVEDVEIMSECENGFEALNQIQIQKPDLIFLDVQMPKISGFELLEVLEHPPAIIFTTAFDQYAIKAFDMSAVDYLLKPFSKERFLLALEKARSIISMQSQLPNLEELKEKVENNAEPIDRVVVRHGSKIIIIPLENIHYFEAQDNYVMVYRKTEIT